MPMSKQELENIVSESLGFIKSCNNCNDKNSMILFTKALNNIFMAQELITRIDSGNKEIKYKDIDFS